MKRGPAKPGATDLANVRSKRCCAVDWAFSLFHLPQLHKASLNDGIQVTGATASPQPHGIDMARFVLLSLIWWALLIWWIAGGLWQPVVIFSLLILLGMLGHE